MHMSIYEMYILILANWKNKKREKKRVEFFYNKRKGRIEKHSSQMQTTAII